eukprot:CAMPEP_0170486412 /NCGR_PEP_ID=MMETSP0208-20121228/5447_1 /TAXON_ID=197538 /ORGANISM="Strombidium inclinatum, Strain S3" /LENGTH=67 /DNA_ID=CAMNT_0010760351 /DNA_START=428 /DNA_END=628 /DNA_ORIENTATION=+
MESLNIAASKRTKADLDKIQGYISKIPYFSEEEILKEDRQGVARAVQGLQADPFTQLIFPKAKVCFV